MTPNRMMVLLHTAIDILECICNMGDSLIGTDLEGELNITQDEYDEIKAINIEGDLD